MFSLAYLPSDYARWVWILTTSLIILFFGFTYIESILTDWFVLSCSLSQIRLSQSPLFQFWGSYKDFNFFIATCYHFLCLPSFWKTCVSLSQQLFIQWCTSPFILRWISLLAVCLWRIITLSEQPELATALVFRFWAYIQLLDSDHPLKPSEFQYAPQPNPWQCH